MSVRLLAALTLLVVCVPTLAQAELVAYWPFEDFPDELTTPDVANNHDLELMTDGFFDAENHVDGKFGKAFEFDGDPSLFAYTQQDPSDKLPINLQPEWTISMWTKVEGTGQNDLRVFSESNFQGDTNPLFNIGTANNGADGSLDIYIRNNQASTGTVGHPHTTAHPFDGEWNHIGWTYADGMHNVWVNGTLDSSYPMQNFGEIDPANIDTTTVGGILRGTVDAPAISHNAAGILDDVAIWDQKLPGSTIFGLATEQTSPLEALEYVGVLPPKAVGGIEILEGSQGNNVFGPADEGVAGWSARIVTFEDHNETLASMTDGIFVLEDYEGDSGGGVAYPVVDFGGGGGTFPSTQPYPNGVDTAAQNDFAVEATANVTIPAGSWTIGVGSDDGGRVLIGDQDFEFDELSDNADQDVDFNEARHEGTRGHGWTVGTFTLDEPLETTITASMFERGGGDSFEVAVLNDAIVEGANLDNGWELLSDGTFGWSVTTEAAPLLSADITGAVEAREGGWALDVNPADGTSDAFALENPDEAVFSTTIDVDGVELHINPLGEVAAGTSFQVIQADSVTGVPIIATDGWSFDQATGSVVFGNNPCNPGTQGDLNGDGNVDFPDFLILSANFGQNVADHTSGDINCDGTVDFPDFLVLSANFGKSVGAGAESIPEPTGLTLLSMAGLLVGLLRRRR